VFVFSLVVMASGGYTHMLAEAGGRESWRQADPVLKGLSALIGLAIVVMLIAFR
jgi:hypothetical protein